MKTAAQWTFEVNAHDFQAKVIDASHEQPILVDFWADWCAPCRAIAPVLDRVLREFGGQVRLAKCEADENMRLAGHYKLRGFPTCILFVAGQPVAHFAGAKPEHFIREFIEEHSDAVAEHPSHGVPL